MLCKVTLGVLKGASKLNVLLLLLCQGWATFVIKRAVINVCIFMFISGDWWSNLWVKRFVENVEFGRCDFLYSGAFWGWPLPTKSSRFITYVWYVDWTNIHSFHVFHAQTATWLVSILITAKGSHTSSFNDVTKLKNSGPTLSATTQWTQTQQAWYSLQGSCSSCSGDLSGNLSWLISFLSKLDTWVCLWFRWTDTLLLIFLDRVFCNSIKFF